MKFVKTEQICNHAEVAILFASYEARALHAAQGLAASGFSGRVFVLYSADVKSQATHSCIKKLSSLFGGKAEIVEVLYNEPEPILKFASSLRSVRSLILDITCFNRENLFGFLWALGIGDSNMPEIQFLYTFPKSYGSWLSRDYHYPHNIVGYGGGYAPIGRPVLVCLVGYEANRAVSVIEAVEPQIVVLAVGSQPTLKLFKERNYESLLQVVGSESFGIFEIDVKDPNKTLLDLRELLDVWNDNDIIIAPFNTKISCLGVFALWLERRDVRIMTSVPERFNLRSYSKGVGGMVAYNASWSRI